MGDGKITAAVWSGGYMHFTGLKCYPVTKAASYTVTAADSGAVFHTTGATGAVTFTLPAPASGLYYAFFNTVDQNMVITCGTTDVIVHLNDAAADSITFSTSSEKIGAACQVWSDGAKWFAVTHNGATATVAT
jgi:hypothetical protein